eukprot:7610521-Karenia_brevis.AAC.1
MGFECYSKARCHLEFGHVRPTSEGGASALNSCAGLCARCHPQKSAEEKRGNSNRSAHYNRFRKMVRRLLKKAFGHELQFGWHMAGGRGKSAPNKVQVDLRELTKLIGGEAVPR